MKTIFYRFHTSYRFLFHEQMESHDIPSEGENISHSSDVLQKIDTLQYMYNQFEDQATLDTFLQTEILSRIQEINDEDLNQVVNRLKSMNATVNLVIRDKKESVIDITEAEKSSEYFQYLSKHPRAFISEKYPLEINGKLVTLNKASLNDFQRVDTDTIRSSRDLMNALLQGQSKGLIEGQISENDAQRLFYFIKNGVSTDAETGELQGILNSLDSSLKNTMEKNGFVGDEKYGFATSEAIQKLSSIIDEYAHREVEVTLNEKAKSLENIFEGRENIVLLLDVTGSMQKNINLIADFIESEVVQKNPNVNIDIRVFDEDGLSGTSFPFRADNHEKIIKDLREMYTGGGGDVAEPVLESTDVLMRKLFKEKTSEDLATDNGKRKNMVVVLSDAPSKSKYGSDQGKNIENIYQKAQKTGTDIFFIAPNHKKQDGIINTIEDVYEYAKTNRIGKITTPAMVGKPQTISLVKQDISLNE